MRFAIEGSIEVLHRNAETQEPEAISVRVSRAYDPDGRSVQRLREPTFWVAADGTMRFSLAPGACHAASGMAVRVEFEPDFLGLTRALHVETLEPL
jgi:hypothetical protein